MMRPVLLFVFVFAFGFLAGASAPAQLAEPASDKTVPFKIYFDQRIRMRDGVELAADVYRPDLPGKFNCILNRTPYLKSSENALTFGRYFAEHGYAFVAVDVRGRGDSPGSFVPYHDAQHPSHLTFPIVPERGK